MSCITYKLCLYHTNIDRKTLDKIRAGGFTIDGTPDASKRATIEAYMQPVQDKIRDINHSSFQVKYGDVNELRKKSWRLYFLIKDYNKFILHRNCINHKEYSCLSKCTGFSSHIESIIEDGSTINISGNNLLALLYNINVINDIELCENNGVWRKKHDALTNRFKSKMKANIKKNLRNLS